MKLLVTGGAGFIGSNFITHVLQSHPDYHIINLDKLTYAGYLGNLRETEGNQNYRFVQGDIGDHNLVDKLISQVDVLINFAAESHVDRSITDPGIFIKTNVEGTSVLLDAARKHGLSKFVQISTDEVYGSLGETGYFTETTQLAPSSPYSASKAGSDLLARAYHETFGVPVVVTRCSNNYGPRQYPEKLIPFFIYKALKNERLPLYGTGLNIRDWLHVSDHCRAIDLVLHEGAPGEVYNIGGNNELTNVEITRIILEHLGKPESLIEYVNDRPGHDARYAIDSTKIQAKLGWKPEFDFQFGIRDTIEWYLKHQDWWKNYQ